MSETGEISSFPAFIPAREGQVPDRPPAGIGAGFFDNMAASYMQDSTIVRGAVRLFRHGMEGEDEGYNPFRDPAIRSYLIENPRDLGLFAESGSAGESRRILARIGEDRERALNLQLGGASWSAMMAGILSPENILTAPLTLGAGTGATVGARVLSGAWRGAALNAAISGADAGMNNQTLPADLARSVPMEMAFAALLGGALGGVGGRLDYSVARRLAGDHATVHGEADGMRTPGVPLEDVRWWAQPGADPARMAEREAALRTMSEAVAAGDEAAFRRAASEAEAKGLVVAGDADLAPPGGLAPGQVPGAMAARNTDGGAADRVLDPRPESLSSGATGAGAPGEAVRLPELFGLGRAMNNDQFPWWQLVMNPFQGDMGNIIAGDASRLVKIPLSRMGGNAEGLASQTRSAEARADRWQFGRAKAEDAMRQAFYRANGWNPDDAGPVLGRVREGMRAARNAYVEARGALERRGLPGIQAEYRMGMAEFRQLVGQAMRTGTEPVNAIGAKVPEALDAARAWRDLLFDPVEQAGAESGLILTGKHAALAEAALQGQLARIENLVQEIDRRLTALQQAGDKAEVVAFLSRQLELANSGAAATRARLTALEEAAQRKGERLYAPQRWIVEKVRAQRDELVARLVRGFEPDGQKPRWADVAVRAEIAVSHILGERAADTLERALARHFTTRQGLTPEAAALRAKELAAPVRDLDVPPSRLKVEAASALGRVVDDAPPGGEKMVKAVVGALKVSGIYTDDSDRLAKEVLSSPSKDGISPNDWRDAYTPGASKERQIDVSPHLIMDFLDNDILSVSQGYLRFMGTAIETAREFGDSAMTAHRLARSLDMLDEVERGRGTLADIEKMDAAMVRLRDLFQGTYAVPEDPDAISLRVLRGMANLAVLNKLGGAIYANLLDVSRAVMAFGFMDLLRSVGDRLGDGTAWRLGGDEAAQAGAALDLYTLQTIAARNGMDGVPGRMNRFERMLETGAANMQFVNLVAPFTQALQRHMGAMLQSQMVELSVKAADGVITAAERTKMAALGIDDDMAGRIADAWRAAGGQLHGRLRLANTDAWADGALREDFRAMLSTALSLVVTRPGVADRPAFMSAPLWQTVLLFKGFGIASTQRMVMSGIAQRDAHVAQAVLAGTALAYIFGGPTEGPMDRHPLLSSERVFEAVNRSGWLGIISDVNTAVETATSNGVGLRPLLGMDPPLYARDPGWGQRVEAITGAATAPFFSMIDAYTGGDGTAAQRVGTVRRMLPFQNLIGLGEVFKQLGRETEQVMP